jgi:hypothetical protein
MRWTATAGLALLLAAPRTVTADYSPLTFAELVFSADTIVVGRIEALRDGEFDLLIEERLLGADKAPTIAVRRFVDWQCARRTPKYAVGQRLVAFLEQGKDARWALGSGCEGEVELVDGRAVTHGGLSLPSAAGDALSEKRFVAVVRALVAGPRDIGEPGFVEAWRARLRHADPIVAAASLARLDAEREVNPGPASAFAEDVVALVGRSERDLRLDAASALPRLLGRQEREVAAKSLDSMSRTGSAEVRIAADLAMHALDANRRAELRWNDVDEPLPSESYLSPLERAVFVPRTVGKRALVAKLVRSARRALNAEKAGDRATARDSIRDVDNARMDLDDDARRAVQDLGVDLDAIDKLARKLDADASK